MAYRAIAARADRHSPLSAADACEYGLAGVDGSRTDDGADPLPQSVARAFAESSSLDALILPGKTIETKVVERALKGYLAGGGRARRATAASAGAACRRGAGFASAATASAARGVDSYFNGLSGPTTVAAAALILL